MLKNHIARWKRLIPQADTRDLENPLRAEIADPLWLLSRQYRLGELTGDDGGSAVAVDYRLSYAPLTRVCAGAVPDPARAQPYDATVPLEAAIESEPALLASEPGTLWAARVRVGRMLLRALGANDFGLVAKRLALGNLRATFALDFDEARSATGSVGQKPAEGPDDLRYRALLRDHALDGNKLLASFDSDQLFDLLVATPGLAQGQQALKETLRAWRDNVDRLWGLTGRGAEAWQKERLEYAFTVAAPALRDPASPAAPTEEKLVAPEYDGDGLGWYSLDEATPGPPLGAAADIAQRQTLTRSAFPKLLSFPGAPADRFWEMEDSVSALGAIGAGTNELSKMVVLDFVLVYSPDWLLVPVEVPVASVASVDWVIVRDTFGHACLVGTAEQEAASTFGRQFQQHKRDDTDQPRLTVLASSLNALRSEPIEEVTLQRDEMANLMWAIERRVEGPSGRGVDRPWFQSEFQLPDLPSDFALKHELLWRFATPVAKTWIPYVAVEQPPEGETKNARYLRRARLQSVPDDALYAAQSRLLRGAKLIREEEVTRAGCRVTLVDQLARGIDGRVHVWRGRTKRPGRGEVSSGLSYDIAPRSKVSST